VLPIYALAQSYLPFIGLAIKLVESCGFFWFWVLLGCSGEVSVEVALAIVVSFSVLSPTATETV